MGQGFDVNQPVGSHASAIAERGYTFVGRYGGPVKAAHGIALTKAEAEQLSAAGLYIVSIWENGFPTEPGYFTGYQGAKDGHAAAEYFEAVGQPKGTPIYFTVDCDIAPAMVMEYSGFFQAAVKESGFFQAAVKEAGYLAGVYGSGPVCEALLRAGIAHCAWLAQSKGWGGPGAWQEFADSGKANLIQHATTTLPGIGEVDLDASWGNAGGWTLV